MYKRYLISVIVATIVMLLMFAGLVIVVDPFAQYHQPLPGFQTVYSRGTQSYVNPGLAKNYDYNSVVVGSSVSENFYASDFDKAFGGKTIKLPYAGGTTMTYSNILETVFREKDIDTVYYSLDYFALCMDATTPRYDMPMDLYDANPFNDVEYVLNKDILSYILSVIKANKNGTVVPLDAAYNWEHEHEFSQDRVLKFYDRPEIVTENQEPLDSQYKAVEAGLSNVSKIIEAHPETNFILFYPPYSILWYDNYKRTGMLEATIGGLTHSMKLLLQYDNVQVYSFACWEDVITDLNNYRESMHFSEKINKRMVEEMASGSFQITKENYLFEMNKLLHFVSNYDCDKHYYKNNGYS